MIQTWSEPWYELAAVTADGSIDRAVANRFARCVPSLLGAAPKLPPGDYVIRRWCPVLPPATAPCVVELGMLTIRGPGRWIYRGLNGPTICPGPFVLRRMK